MNMLHSVDMILPAMTAEAPELQRIYEKWTSAKVYHHGRTLFLFVLVAYMNLIKLTKSGQLVGEFYHTFRSI